MPQRDDGSDALLWLGIVLCVMGLFAIAWRSEEPDDEWHQWLRKTWGATKRGTLTLAGGVMILAIGALFVLTAVCLKFVVKK